MKRFTRITVTIEEKVSGNHRFSEIGLTKEMLLEDPTVREFLSRRALVFGYKDTTCKPKRSKEEIELMRRALASM